MWIVDHETNVKHISRYFKKKAKSETANVIDPTYTKKWS